MSCRFLNLVVGIKSSQHRHFFGVKLFCFSLNSFWTKYLNQYCGNHYFQIFLYIKDNSAYFKTHIDIKHSCKVTDTDVMRTIKFTNTQGIQKRRKLNKNGIIFGIYTPNQIISKLGEHAEVKAQVKVELPDRIFRTLVVLTSIQILGLNLPNILTKVFRGHLL